MWTRVRSARLRMMTMTTGALLLLAPQPSAAVGFDWATVGGPGNAADTEVMTCCSGFIGFTGYGSVPYEYRIAKHEVTNAQYAEFLNAVADIDPNGVYHTNMGVFFGKRGGITRSGTSGSYSYVPMLDRENLPVNWVSFYNAARFANWMHNGQPVGAQGNATTEDGAYTLTPAAIANFTVTRNPGATVFIPSVDEWYKAAYYDVALMAYYNYPASSDTQMVCSLPSTTANHANCSEGDVFEVGSYPASVSPNGTFDQGGNVSEWNDDNFGGSTHAFSGGSLINSTSVWLSAAYRDAGESTLAWTPANGFRVAASLAPEPPSVPSMSPLGIALLSGLLGLASWRMLRAWSWAARV